MPVLQFKGKSVIETYHHNGAAPPAGVRPQALAPAHGGETRPRRAKLIIEDDDLLALKALLPIHPGNVKCIYIDPADAVTGPTGDS